MMILVTGGAGYIGSHTALMLADEGFDVLILDNLSSGRRGLTGDIPLVVGDLRDRDLLHEVFGQHNIGAVFHFASLIRTDESYEKPNLYYSHNLRTTLNLLDAMIEARVDKLIFSSSAAVYGEPVHTPITEEHPLRPVNPYGWTKFMIETMLGDYDRAVGLKSISLRYFNAAGADPKGRTGECHDPETHLIPNIMLAALHKRNSLPVYGHDFETTDGTAVRDYVHVTDLADAHIRALELLLAEGKTESLNLGAGRGYSVLEVIRKVEDVTGEKVPYRIVPRRRGDVPVLLAANAKAARLLQWQPQLSSLETIIRTAWDWHRKATEF